MPTLLPPHHTPPSHPPTHSPTTRKKSAGSFRQPSKTVTSSWHSLHFDQSCQRFIGHKSIQWPPGQSSRLKWSDGLQKSFLPASHKLLRQKACDGPTKWRQRAVTYYA